MADLMDFVFAEKTQADLNFYDYDITISGASGSGKTTLAIELFKDRCCVVDVENGAKAFSGVYKVAPKDWDELKKIQREWAKAIKKGANPPFDVLLFDTQTKLQLMCQEYVLEENDWEDFTQGSDGKNRWNVLKNEYATVMNEFRRLGFKIVRICHGKEKTFKPKNQESYNQYTSDVGASFDYDVIGSVDFVFYLEKMRVSSEGSTKEVRRLILQNDLNYGVKCRFPELPDEIIYEEVKDGVKAFYDAWDEAVATRSGEETTKEKKEKVEFAVKEEPAKKVKPIEDSFEEEDDLESLQDKATKVRDMLLDEHDRTKVISILKENLGTAKITSCDDMDKLKAFINLYN